MKHIIEKTNEVKRIVNEIIGYAAAKDVIDNGEVKPKFKGGVIKFDDLIGKEASTKPKKQKEVDVMANKKPTMGSVKKLKNKNLWRGRFQYKGEVYYSYAKKFIDCFNKHEAKINEVLSLHKQAKTKQTNGFNKYTTLKIWYDYWYKTYKEPFLRDNSKRYYEILFNKHLKEAELLNKKLCKITTFDVQEVIDNIKASTSKDRTKTNLNACFEKAIDTGIITFNPVRAVAIPPAKKTNKRKTLNDEEIKAIFDYCKNSGDQTKQDVYLEMYDLYFLMLNTGLRIGEALALTWEDIDFDKNLISITKTYNQSQKTLGKPKTEKSKRIIPLFKDLKNLLLEKTKDDKFIFKNIMNKQIRDYAKMITSRIGIKFTNHMFRHTFASNCLAKGINPKTIQKWLGHSKLDMTMNVYAAVLSDLEQKDIDKFNNYENNDN